MIFTNPIWITALATSIYALAFCSTIFYIRAQLKENKSLREASVLKEVYDYVIRTHEDRVIIYKYKDLIAGITDLQALEQFKKDYPVVDNAIHSVSNCYHYIGFLMKCGLLTNKKAVFEESGDTLKDIFTILQPVIKLERKKMGKESYKQYFEYLVQELEKFR